MARDRRRAGLAAQPPAAAWAWPVWLGFGRTGRSHRVQVDLRQVLGNVLDPRRYLRRLIGIAAILAQHEAVVLERGSATRSRHQDGIKTLAFDLPPPCVDVV